MKKTLIALVALSGLAMAVETTSKVSVMPPTNFNADSNVVLKGSDDWVTLGWNDLSFANISKDFALTPDLQAEGLHFFTAKGSGQSTAYKSFTYTAPTGTTDPVVSIVGRTAALGTDVLGAYVTSVGTLLENPERTLTGLTLTMKGKNISSADAWWGLYSLSESGTMTQISDIRSGDLRQAVVGTDTFTKTLITLSDTQVQALSATDKLVAMFRVADSAGKTLAINDLSYTVKSTPEPATATLSLLALAGLAARRRRH